MPRRNEHWEALFVTLLLVTVVALGVQVIVDGTAQVSDLVVIGGLLVGKGAVLAIGFLVGLCFVLLFVNFWRVWTSVLSTKNNSV